MAFSDQTIISCMAFAQPQQIFDIPLSHAEKMLRLKHGLNKIICSFNILGTLNDPHKCNSQ